MKRTAKLCVSIVFLAACTLWAGDGRVKLIPELHAGQTYYVLWRTPKRQHGRFTWCVASVAADATRSPQSCSIVTLR